MIRQNLVYGKHAIHSVERDEIVSRRGGDAAERFEEWKATSLFTISPRRLWGGLSGLLFLMRCDPLKASVEQRERDRVF